MAEIQLPTKKTQDEIKANTDSILSNFPINVSGGTDFHSGTTIISGTTISSHYPYEVINITGKGLLHNILLTTTTGYSASIQIDGGTIYHTYIGSSYHDLSMIPFKTSLRIACSYSSISSVATAIYTLF